MAWLTIFLGAFLVFLVEPLVGNTLLPAFGGAASVWNWCLAGFQILLVGGYFYAHYVSSRAFRPALHCALVALGAVGFAAVAAGLRSPWAVIAMAAFPYVILSSNSSLVQSLSGGRYSLYAVSNVGSFVGLFSYPFVFEPLLPLGWQWGTLAVLTVAYAVLLFRLAGKRRSEEVRVKSEELRTEDVSERNDRRSFSYFIIPFSLSFVSCFLLNAVTAHLCSDVTPLPLMWAVLLGVYLLSYVIAFTDRGSRFPWWLKVITVLVAVFASLRLLLIGGKYFTGELVTSILVLFLGGWMIHSRLYNSRPAAADLTRYYLWIAVGGACGGAFCSFLMPHLAVAIVEYPIAMALLVLIGCWSRRWAFRVLVVLAAFGFAVLGFACAHTIRGKPLTASHDPVKIARYRNEYGTGAAVIRPMKLSDGTKFDVHDFLCNSTTHGIQVVDPKKGLVYAPTAYFTGDAGGRAILAHPKYVAGKPMRVAVLGMGMGTLAVYSRPSDVYRMYEINPVVKEYALNRELFTFIPDAKGKVEIVIDDARKALEREREEGLPKFDVIYVDVFNGDSVPPHLSTREAFHLYRDCLEEDGIIAVNITNWHLDLLPMVKAAAKDLGWRILAVDCMPSSVSAGACWAFISAKPVPALYVHKRQIPIDLSKVRDIPQMTDEFHSLLPFLKLFRLP